MNTFQTYLPFYKRNLKVALPIVLSQVGGALVQLVDTFLVGHLGTVELAAVSFASVIFMIGMLGGMGILMGLTPLVGIAFVRNEKARLSQLFENGILLTILVAIVLSLLLAALIPLMPYMGQEPEVVALCIPFFKLMILSLIPYLFFLICKQFLEGLGNTSLAMVITILSNIINIVLAYMLIFGKWGAPALGVLGAGIATFTARLTMPFLFLFFIYRHREWWAYCRAFRKKWISLQTVKELLSIGAPISGQMLLEMLAFSMAGIMAGWLGSTILASNQIASQISSLCFMVVVGIGAATTIRVSHQVGVRDVLAARMAANASIHLCLAYNAVTASLLLLFRVQIASFFTLDAEVIAVASRLLVFIAFFQISDGLQCVGVGTLRGLTDVKIITLYAFISYICINIPVGYVFAFVLGFGIEGIWMGLTVGLTVAAILFHRRIRKRFKEYQQTLPV